MIVKRIKHLAWAVVMTGAIGLCGAQAASADFGFNIAGASLTGSDGQFSRQAGAHADLRVKLWFNRTQDVDEFNTLSDVPDGAPHRLTVDLPPGLVGNPTAAPTCSFDDLSPVGGDAARCPVASQVGFGTVTLFPNLGPNDPGDVPIAIYNMERPDDAPGLFAFQYAGTIVRIVPRIRPGDFGISTDSSPLPQGAPPFGVDLTFWAVPADPSHDALRTDGTNFGFASPDARKPFLTNPTSCPDSPLKTTISADTWEHRGNFISTSFTQDLDGTPFKMGGCTKLPFSPSITVKPLSRAADAPTGLDVDLKVPQNSSPDALATANVKRVSVALPQGMSVSPSSAAGLGACAPSEIALESDAAPTCPDSSKLGTVTIDTPLLDVPLTGDIILAKQDDNPFHSLLAMYIVAKGPGVVIKLPGKIDADPVTGQLTTTFDNSPQLPFTRLHVAFRGGSQASLATPTACGTYSTRTSVTSWASDAPVSLESPMVIDSGCGARDLAPSLSAGTTNPLAGADSSFSLTLTRADGTQFLSRIEAALPVGLLAHLADVPRCAADQANAGNCPAETQIGHTSVLSGPGAAPLGLTGNVYLAGPYGDAPFSLSIVVPTAGQAGPFDLGNVVVRAGIYVDRTDAHVTVKSDPLPTILQGIPLRLRQVNVTIDRPKFMINPTSCAQMSIVTTVQSLEAATKTFTAPFQVNGCAALDMKQKLALKFTGKTQTTDGKHPGIVANIVAGKGTANLKKVVTKLPLSVALDYENAQELCKPAQRLARACPAKSIVGSAAARSVLPDTLRGPVYFVEATRRSPSGRIIATFPDLWIPLSADGVTIDITAKSNVDSQNRLVTTFDNLPDAPIDAFQLNIFGGKHGIIAVSGKPGTCDRSKVIDAQFTGQNGKVVESHDDVAVEGCKPKVTKSSATSRSVTLRLSGLGAGKLSLSGSGVSSTSRTLNSASTASITASLTSQARATLKRHGRVKVSLSARFQPKKGKATTVRKTMTVRR
jgi:hypothetical protein